LNPVIRRVDQRWGRTAACWAACLLCAGCGPTAAPTGTVSGVITLQGKPLAAGTVSFRNDEKGLVASMQLDASGRYELRFAGGKQIPIGMYAVTISPPEPHVLTAAELASEKSAAVKNAAPPPRQDIPQKYRFAETSGLSFTVDAGANTFDLDLQR
jgi:hypothetical protein